MPILSNPRAEAFAQNVAKGMLPIDAFRQVSAQGKKRAGDGKGANRMTKIAKDRVAEIQRASDTATTLTMQERREFMARVARLDLEAFNPAKDGDLLQEKTITTSVTGTTTKYKVPGKRECIMDDAKLAGEIVEPGTIIHNNALIVVMPEDRRQSLLAKKREALERRLAARN